MILLQGALPGTSCGGPCMAGRRDQAVACTVAEQQQQMQAAGCAADRLSVRPCSKQGAAAAAAAAATVCQRQRYGRCDSGAAYASNEALSLHCHSSAAA